MPAALIPRHEEASGSMPQVHIEVRLRKHRTRPAAGFRSKYSVVVERRYSSGLRPFECCTPSLHDFAPRALRQLCDSCVLRCKRI